MWWNGGKIMEMLGSYGRLGIGRLITGYLSIWWPNEQVVWDWDEDRYRNSISEERGSQAGVHSKLPLFKTVHARSVTRVQSSVDCLWLNFLPTFNLTYTHCTISSQPFFLNPLNPFSLIVSPSLPFVLVMHEFIPIYLSPWTIPLAALYIHISHDTPSSICCWCLLSQHRMSLYKCKIQKGGLDQNKNISRLDGMKLLPFFI